MANLRAARCRRDESGSVGDEELDPVATGSGGLGDVQAVSRAGGIADQHAVEVGVLVGLGEVTEVVEIDAAADDVHGSIGLGRLDANHTEEFDGHSSPHSVLTLRIGVGELGGEFWGRTADRLSRAENWRSRWSDLVRFGQIWSDFGQVRLDSVVKIRRIGWDSLCLLDLIRPCGEGRVCFARLF